MGMDLRRAFGIEYEPITVTLVGGPFDGEKEEGQKLPGFDPSPDLRIRIHGRLSEDLMDTSYGPIKYEEEMHRWVRHHLRSRPIKEKTA